jgi:hypothetical protein
MDRLLAVKILHTVVWAFFAGCIVAIPLLAQAGALGWAALLIAVVAVEVGILMTNGMRCPLTDVAAQYTSRREANFDIFLPEWLASNNKTLFGTLYVLGILFTLARWLAG